MSKLGRILSNLFVSFFLLAPAVIVGVMEYGAVATDECNWGSGQLCTDYKGTYGTIAASFFAVWLALTWAINHRVFREVLITERRETARRVIRAAPRFLLAGFVTIILLPASCMSGRVAAQMQAIRTDRHIQATGNLWIESLLWIAAGALMILWAWLFRRTTGIDKCKDG